METLPQAFLKNSSDHPGDCVQLCMYSSYPCTHIHSLPVTLSVSLSLSHSFALFFILSHSLSLSLSLSLSFSLSFPLLFPRSFPLILTLILTINHSLSFSFSLSLSSPFSFSHTYSHPHSLTLTLSHSLSPTLLLTLSLSHSIPPTPPTTPLCSPCPQAFKPADRTAPLVHKLLRAALSSDALAATQPTLLAAAVVAVVRDRCGVHPVWPSALQVMTGCSLGEAHMAQCVSAVRALLQ
jgi:hypothetical protein